MQKRIEILFVVGSALEREGIVGRLVANLLNSSAVPEWSAEATVRRDEETGRYALSPVVASVEIPGTVLLELRGAIERAWQYGRNIEVRSAEMQAPATRAGSLGAPSSQAEGQSVLRAVWPWQEQQRP